MCLQIVGRATQQRCSSHPRCVHIAPRPRWFWSRSAVRTRAPAFWASWADALHMIYLRHPAVQTRPSQALQTQEIVPFSSPLPESRETLQVWQVSSFHHGIPSCTGRAHHPVTLMKSSRAVRGLVGSTSRFSSGTPPQGSSPLPIVERS